VDAGLPGVPFDERGEIVLSPKKKITLTSAGHVDYAPRKRSAFDAAELAQIGRARSTVAGAVRTLEHAMCDARAWDIEAFAASFTRHPILRILGRGLLFLDESSSRLFVLGSALDLAGGARARIVHPIDLRGRVTPDELAHWKSVLSKLSPPPFPQLDREVFVIDDYRRGEGGVQLDSPALRVSATLRFLARRGWVTEEDADDAAYKTTRAFPDGWNARLLHTGIDLRVLGDPRADELGDLATEDGSLHLESLELDDPSGRKIADAPRILFSEAMRDVELAIRAGTG
jgi:hypothetical protein